MASEDEQCQAVVKAMLTTSKAQDAQDDEAYANWEENLVPAPLSIAILGHLICISAGQEDFSINKNPSPKVFKFIKCPESFRACLRQVSNEGWHAFNEAHVNMDQIRLLTKSIPEKIQFIVQTLSQEDEVVKALLPRQLKNLKSIAENCTSRALAVKGKYNSVMSLVQELLETCEIAQKSHNDELKEVKTAMEQAKIREKAVQDAQKVAEKFHNELKQQTDELFQEYKKNMEKIPTGWKAVGMSVAEKFGHLIPDFISSIGNIFSGKMWKRDGDVTVVYNFQNVGPEINICLATLPILSYATGIKDNAVQNGLINVENVYDQKEGQVKINWVRDGFVKVKSKIEGESSCQLKKEAVDLCNFGISICEKLEKIAKSYKEGTNEERVLIDEIEQLYQKAIEFDSLKQFILRVSPNQPKPSNMPKSQQESARGSSAMRNALVKVEQSREMLKTTQEEHQRNYEELKQKNQEMTDLLCDMKNLNMKEINFVDALIFLGKGLKALAEVKEQWEQTILFFQMVSNLMDACLKQKITDFVGSVKDVQGIKGYSSHAFVKDLICKQMSGASNIAHLVYMISDTYTKVSEKHFMGPISSLGKLFSLQASDKEFETQKNALNKACEDAQVAILCMVKEKKEEYARNMKARQEKMDRELKAVLPHAIMEEKKMTADAVHQKI